MAAKKFEHYTNEELAKGILNDDSKTYNVITIHFAPKIKRYVSYRFGTVEDAKDLLQNTLIIMFSIKEKVSKSPNIGGYIWLIFINSWRNFCKNKGRAPLSEPKDIKGLQDLIDDLGYPNVQTDYKKIDYVIKYVNKMKSPCKEIIYMFYVDGWNAQQIAEELGKKPNYIRMTKQRCLNKIRKHFNT